MAKKELSSKREFSAILSALSLMRPGLYHFQFQKKIGIENITTYVLLLSIYQSIYRTSSDYLSS